MSYRDSLETARARREQLLRSLDDARRGASLAREHEARIEGIERELRAVDALLAEGARPNSPELLDNVTIASPCKADWAAMEGDDRVRFCGQCQKNVYNLSALPRQEAEAFLRRETSGICARLYRRADGTVLTSDCPVGVRRERRGAAVATAVGGAFVAAALLAAARPAAHMGAISRPPAPKPAPVRLGDTMGQIGPSVESPPETAPTITPAPSAPATAPRRGSPSPLTPSRP